MTGRRKKSFKTSLKKILLIVALVVTITFSYIQMGSLLRQISHLEEEKEMLDARMENVSGEVAELEDTLAEIADNSYKYSVQYLLLQRELSGWDYFIGGV